VDRRPSALRIGLVIAATTTGLVVATALAEQDERESDDP
jgi:hypothetical protein